MKDLLTVGSVASTTLSTYLDPNSINLLVNAIFTIVVIVLRVAEKKGGKK